jgi:hypothetical protein
MKMLLVAIVMAVSPLAAAQPAADNAPPPPAAPSPPSAAQAARKACTDAMNADPEFAKSILKTFDQNLDNEVITMHIDAQEHIQRNERHVVLAYAALWVIAAGFVVFLWRRQGALRGEIEQLRRDLEAAGKDGK